MKIARGCHVFVFLLILITIIFLFLTFYFNIYFIVGLIFSLIVAVLFVFFFRDPDRMIGEDFVSPADGTIRDIQINKTVCFISIFMNVHNVHVNRIPIDGNILDVVHFSGKHLRAYKKESILNERVVIDIYSKIGRIRIVQIAGLIARRICPYIKKGDSLKKGDKIGIIRLGSRVDVFLPSKVINRVTVEKHSKVIAGVTTIAEFKE
jgi:phosphatidylserine decarboxylase